MGEKRVGEYGTHRHQERKYRAAFLRLAVVWSDDRKWHRPNFVPPCGTFYKRRRPEDLYNVVLTEASCASSLARTRDATLLVSYRPVVV